MRITMIAVGSRGDAQPYVALGLGLQAAGHTVTLATHTEHEWLARERGLSFRAIEGNPSALLESEAGQAWLESANNPIAFVRRMKELTEPIMAQSLADTWEACRDAELIIYSVFGIAGYHIAERLGIPAVAAWLQPLTPTRAFPAANFKPLPAGWLNYVTHKVAEQVLWQPMRPLINRWRVQTLGLPPIPWWGPYRQLQRKQQLILYGYSPRVVPTPADWPAWAVPTGYWFLDGHGDWQPPVALSEFLAAGPKPVYIGFGSMKHRNPQATTELALAALKQSGQRGVLLGGGDGLSPHDLPDSVFRVDAVPHDWLFPRMAVVVHHGGAGTTAAGLRAGVPSILVPFFADQPQWAARVAQLGVGPQPIPRQMLTVERLAAAIRQAVNDTAMQQRAAALGAAIRTEDGIGGAVAALHAHLGVAQAARAGA